MKFNKCNMWFMVNCIRKWETSLCSMFISDKQALKLQCHKWFTVCDMSTVVVAAAIFRYFSTLNELLNKWQ